MGRPSRYVRLASCASLVLGVALGTAPLARAETRVSFDRETLGKLVGALTEQELDFPLSAGRSMRVQLDEVRLLRLEPPRSGEKGAGRIVAALVARVPQLGLTLPLETSVAVDVVELEGTSSLELRFVSLPLTMPLGSVDLAPLVPPLHYPAEGDFEIAGATGAVVLKTRLIAAALDADGLTLRLALDAVPPKP